MFRLSCADSFSLWVCKAHRAGSPDLVSFRMWSLFVHKISFCLLNSLGKLAESQRAVAVWVYFQTLNSVENFYEFIWEN